MNKAADKPLYRQFRPMLVAIFIFVFLALLQVFFLSYLSERQLAAEQQAQLTQLQQQTLYLQYRQKNQTLFRQLMSENEGEQLARLYMRLQDNWQTLAGKMPDNGSEDILTEDSHLGAVIKRLADSSQGNIALKQQSLRQLQLVADALGKIIVDKQAQLELLYQQLHQDKVSDEVTVSRARAQGKIYTELARYNQLASLLAQQLSLFNQLDLQLPLSEFERLRQGAEKIFLIAGELAAEGGQDLPLIALVDEINTLSALLLMPQRTLAKWQGHLRLVHDFRQAFTAYGEKIHQLLADYALVAPPRHYSKPVAGIPGWLEARSRAELLFIAVSFAAALVIAIFCLLLRLHLLLKAYARQTLALGEQLSGEEQVNEALIPSFECGRLVQVVNRMKKPELSPEEVKRLTLGYRMQLKTLAQENHVLYWQQDGEFTLARQLSRGSKYLLQQAVTLGSWRYIFPGEEVKKLILAARETKKTTDRTSVRVFTHTGELLVISLLYREHYFCGTIINGDALAGYEQQLALLSQESQEQQQRRQQLAQQEHQQLAHLLAVAGLQVQSLSCGAAISPRQLYRQLSRASDWLNQYGLLAALKEKQLLMALQDVDLLNELHAVMYNLTAQGRLQQNSLVLDSDPCLASLVTLDVRLFHELLYTLYRLLSAAIFKGQLIFAFTLKDKQPGQQLLQVSAELITGQTFSALPALLELLNSDDNCPQELGGKELVEYFQLLLARHHGSNLLAELTGKGYRLVFDLPLALAKTAESKGDSHEPAPLNLVCLSDKHELQQRVGQLLQPFKLTLYAAAEQMIAELIPGQLKSHPVDVILVSETIFARKKQQLFAFLASLTGALKPKLLVLQADSSRVNELGFYATAALLSRQNLLREIHKLKQQEASTNLLFNRELCCQYGFVETEVEVLLGVKEPSEHQALIAILHWLGLQVRLAANSKSTQECWYSGRFLLLMTEFACPAFVDLDKGKPFERGLFSLPGGDPFTGKGSAKGWRLGQLPMLSDLPALIALLRPWLKEKEPVKTELNQENMRAEQEPSASDQEPSVPDIKGYSLEFQEFALQQQFLNAREHKDEVLAAFDLQRYTRHQHSPELAAYMLDEYLADNRDYLVQLTRALHSRHFQKAGKVLALLATNAGILAAENLLSLCRQMQAITEQKHLNKADSLLEQTRQELDAIENYAESI